MLTACTRKQISIKMRKSWNILSLRTSMMRQIRMGRGKRREKVVRIMLSKGKRLRCRFWTVIVWIKLTQVIKLLIRTILKPQHIFSMVRSRITPKNKQAQTKFPNPKYKLKIAPKLQTKANKSPNPKTTA